MDNHGRSGTLHPDRTSWSDFPDVLIVADVPPVQGHASYAAAKAGDLHASKRLVDDLMDGKTAHAIRALIADKKPVVIPVHALERQGANTIPTAMAAHLKFTLDLSIERQVVQINKAGHTRASGWHRLSHPALFNGSIVNEQHYLIVDDFIGQGGTIANLRGHIERAGGKVIGAITLTGKAYSSKIALSGGALRALRRKHGAELETWWQRQFGYGLDYLTESEARYLIRAESFERIRNQLIEAGLGA